MTELAKFHDRAAMERASARFVKALGGKPITTANDSGEGRLACGHPFDRSHLIGDKVACRICDARAYADFRRQQRLPDMIETTRTKLAHLEAEARRRGQVV